MTHDELIAKINSFNEEEGMAIALGEANNAIYALRAVVELHKPQEITLPDGSWGQNCEYCDNYWGFCLTVMAIHKELQ